MIAGFFFICSWKIKSWQLSGSSHIVLLVYQQPQIWEPLLQILSVKSSYNKKGSDGSALEWTENS